MQSDRAGWYNSLLMSIFLLGPLNPSPTVTQRESAGGEQAPAQSNPSASGDGSSIHHAAPGAPGSSSSTRPEVRVVPIRTVVAAVPASVRRSPSDSSRGSVGLLYPVLARVQHVSSGNLSNVSVSQASEERRSASFESGQPPNNDSAAPQYNIGLPGDGNYALTMTSLICLLYMD